MKDKYTVDMEEAEKLISENMEKAFGKKASKPDRRKLLESTRLERIPSIAKETDIHNCPRCKHFGRMCIRCLMVNEMNQLTSEYGELESVIIDESK